MKICFVDPTGIHFGLNAGIGYIVSYLKDIHGHKNIKVFDFNNKTDNISSRIKEIRNFDVVGFSLLSYTCKSAINIAKQVKTKSNILIAGGPHISIDGRNFLKINEMFDIGVVGEGEESSASILKCIEKKESYDSIRGIFLRKENDIIFTGEPKRIIDLDALPYPDYSSFDSTTLNRISNYPLVTSRGCPYQCTYCCVGRASGKRWVARSVDNIIVELKKAKDIFRFDRFNIQDDNFSLDMDRAKCLCDELIKHNINLRWSCFNGIRADKIDNELMGKMKKSGCFAISVGIESAVEKEFSAIKKGEDFSVILKTIQIAHANNFFVTGNFIIGLPYSTLESVRRSIKFARDLKLEACIFNLLVPFPGTEIWEWVQKYGKILRDWRDSFTIGRRPVVVFETEEFKEEERLKAYYEANTKCKNYFAFLNEHDPLMLNLFYVIKTILLNDVLNLHEHIFWCFVNFKRIILRIIEKVKKR
jgi:radical SAM superfamily enzyme YgiQ (UPF0313 family)